MSIERQDRVYFYNRTRRQRIAGIPLPEWQSGDQCECCGKQFIGPPNIDHDHLTGKFRGWLCSNCNRGIGFLGDNARAVAYALRYLINHEKQFTFPKDCSLFENTGDLP